MPKLLRVREVLNRVPYGRATLYRKIAAGAFPRPVKLGEGERAAVAFLESEVDTWIAERVDARDSEKSAA